MLWSIGQHGLQAQNQYAPEKDVSEGGTADEVAVPLVAPCFVARSVPETKPASTLTKTRFHHGHPYSLDDHRNVDGVDQSLLFHSQLLVVRNDARKMPWNAT
jgi:hypothetical protein